MKTNIEKDMPLLARIYEALTPKQRKEIKELLNKNKKNDK